MEDRFTSTETPRKEVSATFEDSHSCLKMTFGNSASEHDLGHSPGPEVD